MNWSGLQANKKKLIDNFLPCKTLISVIELVVCRLKIIGLMGKRSGVLFVINISDIYELVGFAG